MKRRTWTVIVGGLVAWAATAGPTVEALRPEIALSMDGEGIVSIRCRVTPVGPAGVTAHQAGLQLLLAPETGPWRIVASFSETLSLGEGDERLLTDWRIRLPEGSYTLTWGDPCEGNTVASLSVVEGARGERVLIAPHRFVEPLTPFTVGVVDEPAWLTDPEARRAVAWAQAALAEDLAVCTRRIEVTQVLGREFPDASLGVREPGMVYAQLITPGYVVRLAWDDREFEYRVAGSLLVRVPDAPAGPAPDEVWVVHVFAYHGAVDLLLHGHMACSPAAVLPLRRWTPLDSSPLEEALALLLSAPLLSWEVEAGYTSEFPLAGVARVGVSLDSGVLWVTLADPEHHTSGGACRTAILRAQIERTALQFTEVMEVHVLPPEILQP